MKLTWYGHACFLVETAEGSVVFDPYAPGSVPGLHLPALEADTVICSHGHDDHNYEKGVRLTGRKPSFRLEQIPCWHDGECGRLRGPNTITLLEAEGLRLAHLGDLGHMLSQEQLAALGKVDVLLIPVGGYFTIDAAQAAALAEEINAGITVPMHYRGEGFGYEVIGPVEDFLRRRDPVLRLESHVLETGKLETPVTAALRCPVG